MLRYRQIMPSPSTEKSHGIAPDYRCAGALVRWRRILGSQSRSLVTNRLFARKGQWWFAVDRLIEDRNAGVTDAERQQLVADLEESPGVVSLCYLANIRVRPEMQEGGAAQLLSSFFRISITGKNREGCPAANSEGCCPYLPQVF
jgi:hypothetical protein